ncbi:MAG: twin-arginine translocase subunit TatC [Kiritimatiellia bacterium]
MAISLIKNPDERNDPPRPLMEHFYALRDMFITMAMAWSVCFIVAAAFSPTIMDWLKEPVRPYIVQEADSGAAATNALAVAAAPADAVASTNEVASVAVMQVGDFDGTPRWQLKVEGLDVTSGVTTIITIGAWGGTALAFPFLMFALLRFIFPALTRREKVVLMTMLIVGTVLFLGGVALAYAQTLPMIVTTFLAVNDWLGLPVETLRIDGYIPLILKTIIAFGLVFQVPLILFILGWFGIISSETLRAKRRWAIVLAFILAMLLTPPDPMSQIIMAVPLCCMYEIALWAVWLRERLARAG